MSDQQLLPVWESKHVDTPFAILNIKICLFVYVTYFTYIRKFGFFNVFLKSQEYKENIEAKESKYKKNTSKSLQQNNIFVILKTFYLVKSI